MKVYPFVAAEKAAGHTVKTPCALLGVSRSAYYDWTKRGPSARIQADESLRRQISNVHQESGAPTAHHVSISNSAVRVYGHPGTGLHG